MLKKMSHKYLILTNTMLSAIVGGLVLFALHSIEIKAAEAKTEARATRIEANTYFTNHLAHHEKFDKELIDRLATLEGCMKAYHNGYKR